MSDRDVDVIVVGGGPVGLATAIESRLAGLSVVVIEPRADAVDKACGEGLMPGALPLLARLGVDPVGMPLLGVSYLRGSRRADHLFRTGPGRGVRRTVLHSALSHRADELGVERVSARVEALDADAAGVTAGGLRAVGDLKAVGDLRAAGDVRAGWDLRASWLVAADGLHSTIRRLAGLERTVTGRGRRFGLRQHFEVPPWSELIEVHWADRAEVYITPVSPTVVGVAVLGPAKTDFAATIAALPALAARLRGARPASGLRGAGPFRQRAARPSRGRVLLVGDASGYVDAITGEGLRLGFEQARLAVDHIRTGTGYDPAWRAATRDFRMLTSQLVGAATGPLRPAIVPLATTLPGVYGSIVERLAR